MIWMIQKGQDPSGSDAPLTPSEASRDQEILSTWSQVLQCRGYGKKSAKEWIDGQIGKFHNELAGTLSPVNDQSPCTDCRVLCTLVRQTLQEISVATTVERMEASRQFIEDIQEDDRDKGSLVGALLRDLPTPAVVTLQNEEGEWFTDVAAMDEVARNFFNKI